MRWALGFNKSKLGLPIYIEITEAEIDSEGGDWPAAFIIGVFCFCLVIKI